MFPEERAKALRERYEFVYTPKHGSWLNMAEIELNVLTKQCPNRRIADIEIARAEVSAWQAHRNNREAKVNRRFTTENARIKPARFRVLPGPNHHGRLPSNGTIVACGDGQLDLTDQVTGQRYS